MMLDSVVDFSGTIYTYIHTYMHLMFQPKREEKVLNNLQFHVTVTFLLTCNHLWTSSPLPGFNYYMYVKTPHIL